MLTPWVMNGGPGRVIIAVRYRHRKREGASPLPIESSFYFAVAVIRQASLAVSPAGG